MRNPFKKQSSSRSALAYFLRNDDSDVYIPGYHLARNCDEVKRCVNVIADYVSNMTIMLLSNTDKAGDDRIRNGLSRFIDITPCKTMTRKAFIQHIVNEMYIKGNAVCLPEFDNSGHLTNLRPLLNPQFIEDPVNDSYKILYNGISFEPDEVLHFVRKPNKSKPYKGVDCVDSLTNTIQNLLQAQVTKKGFLRSEWKPSLVVSVSADAEELQDKELREKILKSYTETNRAGEPWLIPAGEIDVKEVKPLSLADLAIQDGLNLDIKCVAADLGVPPYDIGIGEFSKDAHNHFIGSTVYFTATVIAQELTRKILYKPEWYVKFNNKSLMQFTPAEKMTMVGALTDRGILTRNEGRTEFDYPPVDDPEMDEHQVLENYIPIDKLGSQKKLEGGKDDK